LHVPYNATRRADMAQRISPSAPIVWIASNCNSRSNRESFVRNLMKFVAIDSFGRCLNNREAGPFAMRSDGSNWNEALENKHALLRAYKFVLVLENTIEPSYVSEKIFDAWEAGSVPLYLGAPDIADFAVSPDAYINLQNMTPAEVGNLVESLDTDEQAYAKFHAWRNFTLEQLLTSPLAERLKEGNHDDRDFVDVFCDICKLVSS